MRQHEHFSDVDLLLALDELERRLRNKYRCLIEEITSFNVLRIDQFKAREWAHDLTSTLKSIESVLYVRGYCPQWTTDDE